MDSSLLKEANPWWEDPYWHTKDFHLTNLEKLRIKWDYKIIEKMQEGVYSLRGPRQVGKTSWIKKRIRELTKETNPKNVLFYSCDNIKREDLSELLLAFFDIAEKGRKFIFLDEIPFVEGWEFVIKHFYDSGKFKDCFVLICGSNSLDIKRSAERLPGRGDSGKRHFVMQPLFFAEFIKAAGLNFDINSKKIETEIKLKFNDIKKAYLDYLMTGGFLKIINEFYETSSISDSSYDVYLKWIIGDISKLNLKEKYAKQILRRVLEVYTSEISWSSLASGTEIDTHNTTSKYVSALEEMFILQILYKMEFNKKIPDYPKSKKIYIFNPFILASIYKWVNSIEGNFSKYQEYLNKNIDKISEGVLLNHIAGLLIKNTRSDIFNYNDVLYYWTNKEKTKEIDFVLKDLAIELKYQNSINSSDYKSLREFKNSYLVTKQTFDRDTYPLPAFLILLEKILITH